MVGRCVSKVYIVLTWFVSYINRTYREHLCFFDMPVAAEGMHQIGKAR